MKHMTPAQQAEIIAYQAMHPEVDWTANEVLFRYDIATDTTFPDGYWSHNQRDETYLTLMAMGFRVTRDADGDWHLNCCKA